MLSRPGVAGWVRADRTGRESMLSRPATSKGTGHGAAGPRKHGTPHPLTFPETMYAPDQGPAAASGRPPDWPPLGEGRRAPVPARPPAPPRPPRPPAGPPREAVQHDARGGRPPPNPHHPPPPPDPPPPPPAPAHSPPHPT